MKKGFLFLPMSLAILCGVYAVQPPEGLVSLQPNPEGTLGLKILSSENPDFIREWMKTDSKHSPYIKGVRRVVPNQMFHFGFVVTGMARKWWGGTDCVVHWKLLDPKGLVTGSEQNFATVDGRVPDKPGFVMADPVLDVTLEESDSKGMYTLEAMAEDRINKTHVTAIYVFELAEKK